MSATLQPGVTAEAVNAKTVALIASGAVALGVALSGFVIREPAPYELYMAALIAVWALLGLRISRGVVPLLILLVTFNIGGALAMTQMADISGTPLYLMVSLFLGLTSVFYAAVLERDPSLFKLIFVIWTLAATVTSALGILGYFNLVPGASLFTLYGRASGAFQDPNVFGPYLVPPALFLLHATLTGRISRLPFVALPLLVILGGLFLSFSRGAWGLFAATAIVLTAALFIQTQSGRVRLRIVVMSLLGLLMMAILLIIILQLPGVAELFTTRAQLVQDYDGARLGRFARYAIGFSLALEKPLGIGPLVFGQLYSEDTHNIWLKALMDYGWLGFVSWLTLMLWTIAAGFRILFRDRPWQPFLLCAYIAFLGHLALGSVIDIDHWRHFYLLLGLVWGAIALEYRRGMTARRHLEAGRQQILNYAED
ncbi:O-antigen ligase family protein [Mesorhizobium sp. RP14(2022)]|uniref:O-antigen ligase family protein n=1 Tax=Mesorhizobium liriopis TaxID=2953882 RepID=A0ABT1C9A4_9HYPH|nr:O-antigen ligase family protein [Mesorhizobium liriopis]MCO6050765.1 O-antigen ligase family protein [Mesorhizobium liriopis]